MGIKLPIILAILLFKALFVSAQSNVGLVAHWPFNGNTNDSTGNGHSGTANNTTMGQGITGQLNTAYYFNGLNSNIDVPYQADLNINRYSICTVIKPMGYYTGACQGNFIVSRSLEGSAGSYFLMFFDNAYDGNDCGAQDTSNDVFAAAAGTPSGNITDWQYTPHIVSNTWYTVIATYDGSNIKIYVDGVLKSTHPVTVSSISSTFDDLYIGSSSSPSFPYWFKGYMDDLRLYNRVLADSEVKQYATKIYMTKAADTVCEGASRILNVKMVNGSFVQTTGTVFSVERSDLSGSFASPVTIGTQTVGSSGTPNAMSITYTIPAGTAAGHYKLRVRTSALAMYSDESDLYVYSVTTPSVGLTSSGTAPYPYGSTVTFTASATNAGATPTFKWYKNSSLIAGQSASTYTALAGLDFNNADTILVVVKSLLPCASVDTAAVGVAVAVTLGITDNKADHSFTIYPNPNKGSFRLKGYANAANAKLEVLNTIGQTIYSETLTTTRSFINQEVNVPGINNGIYLLRLNADGITKTVRLVVQ